MKVSIRSWPAVLAVAAMLWPARCPSQTVSAEEYPSKDQLWIRVSQPGRLFWHVGPHHRKNLPRLLPSDSASSAYRADWRQLYELLLQWNSENDHLITLILGDPAGDFRLVDSVFTAIDRVSHYFDSVMATGLEVTTEKLPDEARHDYRYSLVQWNNTDVRLHQVLPGILRLSSLPPREVAEEDTYAHRLKSGHWKDRQEQALKWERRVGRRPRVMPPQPPPQPPTEKDSTGGR